MSSNITITFPDGIVMPEGAEFSGQTFANNQTPNFDDFSTFGAGVVFQDSNPIDFEDTTFTWFPLDSLVTLNPTGRLYTGRAIESSIDISLDLSVSHLIAVKVKGFWPTQSSFEYITEMAQSPHHSHRSWNT